MRQIAIIFIFGALLLPGCSRPPAPKVSSNTQEETSNVIIVPNDYERKEIIIQAQETKWPRNKGKTYNELQKSDDLDDYPFTPSSERNNFNQDQVDEEDEDK